MSDDSPLRVAVERSRIGSGVLTGVSNARSGQVLQDGIAGSRFVTAARATLGRTRDALKGSAALHRVRDAGQRLSRSVASASTTRIADSAATAARHSWLYRWLTAEPDQEVIVIDLRETLTVAPFIVTLDRFLERVLPARAHSLLVRTATRGVGSMRSAPVRGASALLVVAVLASLVVAVARGALSPLVFGLQLLALLTGLAGLRVDTSWADLRETRAARSVAAALEPPPPPEERD